VIEAQEGAHIGVIAFGSTEPAIQEACLLLAERGIKIDFLRVRAIPFSSQVGDFIRQHVQCYVVEMNRDGQLHQLLCLEYLQDANRLKSIAYTDGLPMTARFVSDTILALEEK
jgi:2-oxoglutarate ferredoxin oxidoreductase subunit alpha